MFRFSSYCLLIFQVAELHRLHDQGLLINERSRITIAYGLRDRGKTLVLPMSPADVDFLFKSLFVAQGLLTILSTLFVKDESVGDEWDCVKVGEATRERPLMYRCFSFLLQCLRAIV